ncbi:MAG: hypothetical protein ACOCQR_01075 [bacterium]
MLKRMLSWMRIKVDQKIKSLQTVEDRLNIALTDLKAKSKEIEEEAITIETNRLKMEKMIKKYEESSLPNKDQLIVRAKKTEEKLAETLKIVAKKKKTVDNRLEEFKLKKEELKTEHQMLTLQKEQRRMLADDYEELETSYEAIVQEIENEILNMQSEIEAMDNLYDKGILIAKTE